MNQNLAQSYEQVWRDGIGDTNNANNRTVLLAEDIGQDEFNIPDFLGDQPVTVQTQLEVSLPDPMQVLDMHSPLGSEPLRTNQALGSDGPPLRTDPTLVFVVADNLPSLSEDVLLFSEQTKICHQTNVDKNGLTLMKVRRGEKVKFRVKHPLKKPGDFIDLKTEYTVGGPDTIKTCGNPKHHNPDSATCPFSVAGSSCQIDYRKDESGHHVCRISKKKPELDVEEVYITFHCLGSCCKNQGMSQARKNWDLVSNSSIGGIQRHSKTTLQVMDTIRKKTQKRAHNGEIVTNEPAQTQAVSFSTALAVGIDRTSVAGIDRTSVIGIDRAKAIENVCNNYLKYMTVAQIESLNPMLEQFKNVNQAVSNI